MTPHTSPDLLPLLRCADMRGDVQDIFKMTPHDKQVMMFSATLSKEIRPICKKFMSDVSPPRRAPAAAVTPPQPQLPLPLSSLLLRTALAAAAPGWRAVQSPAPWAAAAVPAAVLALLCRGRRCWQGSLAVACACSSVSC